MDYQQLSCRNGTCKFTNSSTLQIVTVISDPWSVELTGAVKPGKNDLEIEVVNTWVNRLIGDAGLPPQQRITKTNVKLLPEPAPRAHLGFSPKTRSCPPAYSVLCDYGSAHMRVRSPENDAGSRIGQKTIIALMLGIALASHNAEADLLGGNRRLEPLDPLPPDGLPFGNRLPVAVGQHVNGILENVLALGDFFFEDNVGDLLCAAEIDFENARFEPTLAAVGSGNGMCRNGGGPRRRSRPSLRLDVVDQTPLVGHQCLEKVGAPSDRQ